MKVVSGAPGKLYLAGEYAVVEAGHPALIMAVDRWLWVTVTSAEQAGSIQSSQQSQSFFSWERRDGRICFREDQPYSLIASAMQVVEDYAAAIGRSNEGYYHLSVESDLDHTETGKKYGLGSSGAVTVAVVKALLNYYQMESSPLLVYKLAVVAQLRIGATGSFGDLAASSHGGVVAYYSVDRDWLKGQLGHTSLRQVVEMDWKDLQIFSVDLPHPLEVLIGWTGEVASTERLVQQVQAEVSQQEKEEARVHFLKDSQQCVEELITACRKGQVAGVKEGIVWNRRLLKDFSRQMNLVLETSILETLCHLALQEGAVAKSSGAGGGDCGICLVENLAQREKIVRLWLDQGIEVLEAGVAERQ